MNVDQIETEVKTLSMVTKINAFALYKKIKFHLLEKNSPPTRKPNGLADSHKK